MYHRDFTIRNYERFDKIYANIYGLMQIWPQKMEQLMNIATCNYEL